MTQPQILTDEEITVLGNKHSNRDTSMYWTQWPDFARAIEARIFEKLAGAEVPEPEIFDSDEVYESGYTLDQLRTATAAAYLRGAREQLSKEPVAWMQVDSIGERFLCFSQPSGVIEPLYTLAKQEAMVCMEARK